MNPEIKNRFTGAIIVEAGKYESIKEAVEKSGANLYRADLSGANLYRADLYGANLYGANLSGAKLSGADLSRANLYGADLSGANLYRADLSGANLSGADLSRAKLYGANLSGAKLSGADLYGADLSRADLSGAKLSGAKNFTLDFYHCPEEGSFIAWKKCRNHIVKLVIPNDAKRTSCVINRKCRAEYVKTIALFNLSGNRVDQDTAYGIHNENVEYKVGQITKADSFDSNIFVDCSHGIHFFITRKEAEEWK
jgi:hypothetical protein